jgi:single-strand DNA-binding protein
MNGLKNKVQLIGHAGETPTIKDVNGSKMARFSLATNETYTNAKGEKVTDTQWHTLIFWGKLAELAESYIQKGSEVAIEGKLQYRNYTKDEVKRFVTEIVVSEFILLTRKAD